MPFDATNADTRLMPTPLLMIRCLPLPPLMLDGAYITAPHTYDAAIAATLLPPLILMLSQSRCHAFSMLAAAAFR